METKATQLLAKSHLNNEEYSKEKFIELIQALSQDDFNRLCKEIALLTEYYHTSVGSYVCDLLPFLQEHPDKFYKLGELDFNRQVVY